MSNQHSPIIGIVTCSKNLGGYSIQAVNESYIDAVEQFSGTPILLPSAAGIGHLNEFLDMCDGFLFTGSHSNVEPSRYNAAHDESYLDRARDELALNLIRASVDANKPCFGICRGFQEMNVALGGTLEPCVHEAGYNDHRENPTEDMSEKYSASHSVIVQEKGIFASWLSDSKEFDNNDCLVEVNSLHNQGIKHLASNLSIEAKAFDGLVEAFSLPDHKYFIGVQWHPEWNPIHNSFSQLLFKKFIMAASNNN
ncbi:gamma-glutamyl-gamma-aminobutyrate hydrolase family protein [Vibrio marisflavi]|uniref:Gamma-glutamyl-gamma-aminobutyrate hydrolase PuuD n=1 Tax=Vibrio marisflavi CECT 7928 TaxID=634439 RepID=A0ABM9A4F9_9VIBR|nr:gamma-glutamyl-gamma-aminobutyrate hydrolase family protein [Vibrio marisflavi]CAH0539667.1 Gamma-glutamyl-gamma-aminobutyrate hydrolase PuuD [Vibrio marisflavi CECT 7928]